jgi:hypothetical protein
VRRFLAGGAESSVSVGSASTDLPAGSDFETTVEMVLRTMRTLTPSAIWT